jgi:hypothetical protein
MISQCVEELGLRHLRSTVDVEFDGTPIEFVTAPFFEGWF